MVTVETFCFDEHCESIRYQYLNNRTSSLQQIHNCTNINIMELPCGFECIDGRHYHCNMLPLPRDYLNRRKTDFVKRLCQYGHYTRLISLITITKQYSMTFINAISAMEQYEFYTSVYMEQVQPWPNAVLAVVDNMNKSQRRMYSEWIIGRFLNDYIAVVMFSIINLPYVPYKNCSDYKTNKKCDQCEGLDFLKEIYLGYLMVFCSSNILNQLKSISRSKLKQMLMLFYESNSSFFDPKQVNTKLIPISVQNKLGNMAKIMKKWNQYNVRKKGRRHILRAFNWYCNFIKIFAQMKGRKGKLHACNRYCNCDQVKKITDTHKHGKNVLFNAESHTPFHVMGKLMCWIDRRYDIANQYFVIATCITNDLYERVLSLSSLSYNCYLNGQYFIGMKILRSVYKLCNGYILPSLVKKCRKQKKKFVKKINKLRCINCNVKGYKLNACKGCMKTVYCSVHCQKIHWKTKHRNQCDKLWKSKRILLYSMIKTLIFDRL
eukprot:367302_1